MEGSLADLEESVGGSAAVGAILDLGLLGQILGGVDRGRHLVGCQEGCGGRLARLLLSSRVSPAKLAV